MRAPQLDAKNLQVQLPASSFERDSKSVDRVIGAGMATNKLNTEYKLYLKLLGENKRNFDNKDEDDRKQKMKGIRKKDH